jgi:hypothetical protein
MYSDDDDDANCFTVDKDSSFYLGSGLYLYLILIPYLSERYIWILFLLSEGSNGNQLEDNNLLKYVCRLSLPVYVVELQLPVPLIVSLE